MKIKVLCKVIHGSAYGKKGDIIDVPDAEAAALIREKKASAVAEPKK